MRANLHDPSDLTRLRELIGRESHARQRDRYRVVLLAAEGLGGRELKREEISDAVGRSRQFVDEWVRRYRGGGVGALRPRKQPGRTPWLSAGQKRELGEVLDAGPQEGVDPRSVFFAKDVRELIGRRFGKLYSLSGVYKLLGGMGYSWLCPRPRHPEGFAAADAAGQEALKKKWPGRSRRPGGGCSPPSRASGC